MVKPREEEPSSPLGSIHSQLIKSNYLSNGLLGMICRFRLSLFANNNIQYFEVKDVKVDIKKKDKLRNRRSISNVGVQRI